MKKNNIRNKAGKIKTCYIIVKSMLLFLKYCTIAIILSFSKKKNKNQLVDTQLRIWAKKILAYPHANLIVIIYLSAPGTIRMIAKKELFKIPLFGLSMKRNEVISINRSNKESAIKSLESAKNKMKKGIVLWMAPEGTRSKNGELLAFKKGVFVLAIETGAKIYPIGIKGAHDILPAKTINFKLNQKVEVNIGDPIDASKYNLDNKEELIDYTRERIKELIE